MSYSKFVLLLLAVMTLAVSVTAEVPTVISYQGKLMESSGIPVTDGPRQMTFAIYDAETSGNQLWFETNPSVQVTGGLFSVLLGSVKPFTANVFDGADRWFGVTIGTDPELAPRQRIASAAFAQIAKTVVDGAITVGKLADGAVTANKLAPDAKIPAGVIVMWSGATPPPGWALCNGQNGTPDLRDKFIVGGGSSYSIGSQGGASSHSHVVNDHTHEMNHTHGMNHQHTGTTSSGSGPGVYSGNDPDPAYRPSYVNHNHTFTTDWTRDQTDGTRSQTGGATPGTTIASSLPPFYALAFIMKL